MDNTAAINLSAKKAISVERATYGLSLAICGMAALYLLTVFITGHSWLPLAGIDSQSPELTLSLIQCLLGAAALHLPLLITKATRLEMPDTLCVFFYLFVLCGTVLGEVFSLYYRVPVWDSLLHFAGGLMAGMLGSIALVSYLKKKKCEKLLSPAFVLIAAICFSVCIGVAWEIYEFAGDSLLGLNMQKSALENGMELVGQAALMDTMKDLIVDTAGAIAAAVASYLSLKRKKGWLYSYQADPLENVSLKLNVKNEELPYSA